MVYQLYAKCNEIKEIDEPDDVEPNMCYSCCIDCYKCTYGPRCKARGLKCYNMRTTLKCECFKILWWLCGSCCCKTPCIKYTNDQPPPLKVRPGCCMLKTNECCKLYTGDVIVILFREIVCVSFPLAVMIYVGLHRNFNDYDDYTRAGIGLGISLAGFLPLYIVVYCLTQLCRTCLVCSSRCGVQCCHRSANGKTASVTTSPLPNESISVDQCTVNGGTKSDPTSLLTSVSKC